MWFSEDHSRSTLGQILHTRRGARCASSQLDLQVNDMVLQSE